VGLTEEAARQQLQQAHALFAQQRGATADAVPGRLQDLAAVTAPVTLPRPTAVRRAGRRRRRSHTVIAVLAAVGVALGSGAIAYEPPSVQASPPKATGSPTTGSATAVRERPPSQMLDADQITRLGQHQDWRVVPPEQVDQALDQQCRLASFPDPRHRATEVRAFRAAGTPERSAMQRLEVSASALRAQQAYQTLVAWYAQCEMARLQLRDTYRVDGVGDAASALRFQLWQRPATSYWVSVVRIGVVTTSTVSATVGGPPPPLAEVVQSLADSVAMVCGASGPAHGAMGCEKHPAPSAVPAPSGPEERGLLDAIDLPPVGDVQQPWAGTTPRPARDNPAATTCDDADFIEAGATLARTRTFLIPGAHLPSRFGLSETYGVFGSAATARRFMALMTRRVDRCEVRNLATTVHPGPAAARHAASVAGLRTWRLDTAVTARRTVSFRLGFVRVGNAVAEVTFSPAGGNDIPAGPFRDLLLRAGERLRGLGQGGTRVGP
jgi:hypothetical protein